MQCKRKGSLKGSPRAHVVQLIGERQVGALGDEALGDALKQIEIPTTTKRQTGETAGGESTITKAPMQGSTCRLITP